MKEILALIEKQKQEFAQLPLFEFMKDKSIDPRQRLAWAPCAAPFIMTFGELNKYFLRTETTDDPIQKIINQYTHEDDSHWLWFLEDLHKLEVDRSLKFSDALKFIWSEETKNTRWLSYQLYQYSSQANSLQKLIVIEVTEATSHVMLPIASEVSKEITAITQQEYQYFGDIHLIAESEHTIDASNLEQFVGDIQLTTEARQEAIEIVKQLFVVFTKFTNELLTYAQNHKIKQLVKIT
ncbi:hypothetical protein I8752_16895 [Nostocaceae cyanobacterium CENA369]|uniref:Uncharacterized protein n=1 Tax=Dendronalium phyllosphericum CENA369 TaxID=1725256 RepID=A0A8J7LE82_9NOST|nr:hypothetical protein [Dendronalium phyllosphericum]MBH8574672.1 hypothetical protein [Dendronalium phyllosphericum CENA369]